MSFERPFWIDTHAHLSDSQFDSDRSAVISRACLAEVALIVEIADGPLEWKKAKQLSESYPDSIYWAGGFHPYYAADLTDQSLLKLEMLSRDPQFVAVGEVGLDYVKATSSPDDQKKALHRSIDLAFNIGKPLIIHCREAYADIVPLLKIRIQECPERLKMNPGVIHCFSGSAADADKLISMGFYLGVDAPITYPNAKNLREIIKTVPVEKLVLETDSPYLPPQGFRGKRNDPGHIPLIAASLADIKNITLNTLRKILFENSLNLYRIKPR